MDKNIVGRYVCPVCERHVFVAPNEIDQLLHEDGIFTCPICGYKFNFNHVDEILSGTYDEKPNLQQLRKAYIQWTLDNPLWTYSKDVRNIVEQHSCPKCHNHIFSDTLSFEICPSCGYEDDGSIELEEVSNKD